MRQPLRNIFSKHSEETFCLFNIFLEPLETLQQYSGKDMLICAVLEISRRVFLSYYFFHFCNKFRLYRRYQQSNFAEFFSCPPRWTSKKKIRKYIDHKCWNNLYFRASLCLQWVQTYLQWPDYWGMPWKCCILWKMVCRTSLQALIKGRHYLPCFVHYIFQVLCGLGQWLPWCKTKQQRCSLCVVLPVWFLSFGNHRDHHHHYDVLFTMTKIIWSSLCSWTIFIMRQGPQ